MDKEDKIVLSVIVVIFVIVVVLIIAGVYATKADFVECLTKTTDAVWCYEIVQGI